MSLWKKAKSLARRTLNHTRVVSKGMSLNSDSFRKLHLGCGNVHADGFCNIDAQATLAVDFIDDISTLKRVPDGSAELIYACHVLEHFGHEEIVPILKRWHTVLKPGGELRISVPDMDRIVKIYHKNWEHFQTDGNSPWIGLIFGGQADAYDFHKTGFNFNWLTHLLKQAGFKTVSEYPHEPHFIPGFVDASLAKEPFGEMVSLNVVAKKGAQ